MWRELGIINPGVDPGVQISSPEDVFWWFHVEIKQQRGHNGTQQKLPTQPKTRDRVDAPTIPASGPSLQKMRPAIYTVPTFIPAM